MVEKLSGQFDWVQMFVKNKAEIDKLAPRAVKALKPERLLWVSFPKGSSQIQTDLTRDVGWEALQGRDLKWVALVSVDNTWSAFASPALTRALGDLVATGDSLYLVGGIGDGLAARQAIERLVLP